MISDRYIKENAIFIADQGAKTKRQTLKDIMILALGILLNQDEGATVW